MNERWQDFLRSVTRPKKAEGESDVEWTQRLIDERLPGVNRQCAIGYHSECSDPDGEDCTCGCHWYSLEDYIIAIVELEAENAALRATANETATERER